MQLIEINEPNNVNSNYNQNEIAVGIDFGTTHSLIAISINKKVRIFKNLRDEYLIPSVITFQENNHFIIGDKSRIEDTIYSIKRLFGKSKREIQNSKLINYFDKNLQDEDSVTFKFKYNNNSITIAEAASEIFIYLKDMAQEELGAVISKAVVTTPAYFDDTAKGEVMLGAKLAGFQVMRLISEPTAAAYAYGIENNTAGQYIIYDFGGGTFDVSILNIQSGIFQVLATGGDNNLGGDDIDLLIANYLAEKYSLTVNYDILKLAKYIKHELHALDNVEAQYLNSKIEFNRENFESLIRPLISSTVKLTRSVLNNIDDQNVNGIILIGGSSRILLVKKMLSEEFNVEIFSDINPDEAVVRGAAMQAENLTSNLKDNDLILDVVPLSLGLELYGGIAEKIILRNSPIPISVTKEFTNQADNQTAIILHITQGEREMASDCRSLAKFELKNLPLARAGHIKIEVIFSIDANGILSVSAQEKLSGKISIVEVKPTYGLSPSEIEKLIYNAFENANLDHKQRLLSETKIKAESIIEKLEKSMQETPELIDDITLSNINSSIEKLKYLLKNDDRDDILTLINDLENLSSDFNQTRMQYAIKNIITGKNINRVDLK